METRTRSIVKAFSWRITATLLTMTIAWIVTKDYTIGLSIGAADFVVKLIVYYFHERLWHLVKIGYLPHTVSNTRGDGI